MQKEDQWEGFAVELWEYCADEMGRGFEYLVVRSADEKIAALEAGNADVAIAGISVTKDREAKVDFSVSTLDSGLRIMVLKDHSVLPTMSPESRRMVRLLLVFLVFCAHVLWWAERGGGAIHREYFPGILEAFWCVFATMSTVGYGDIAPKQWLGRLMAVVIMFSGISLFGIFAATLTADFVTEKRLSSITSVQQLHEVRVATKRETTSSRYLESEKIRFDKAETFEELCRMLENETVDAVVYDEPAILYHCLNHSEFIATDNRFSPDDYAFAFPEDSSLLEGVNNALLKAKESGTYGRIHGHWFQQ